MRRVLCLLLLSPLLLFAEGDPVRDVLDEMASTLSASPFLTYRDESFSFDDAGRIEELTLHVDVDRVLDQLMARDVLKGVHTLLLRDLNGVEDGELYFSTFPLCADQIGVRLYCSSTPSSPRSQQMLGGLVQQLMLRLMAGSGQL